ncbi:unnamed protein product, partial [Rotaria magnacalcarata]
AAAAAAVDSGSSDESTEDAE